VLLSVVASVKRHGVNPWAYLKRVLNELPARPEEGDLADLLPDRGGIRPTGPVGVRG